MLGRLDARQGDADAARARLESAAAACDAAGMAPHAAQARDALARLP